MARKKAQKMSLNQFIGDTAGSWADEMEALPSGPALRTGEERGNDRFSNRDDFMSSRPDRVSGPPREDLPLPTQPPYTAFIGNLAFDLTDVDLEEFFSPLKIKTVKIIKDRDDKPKGFGYIEFVDLEDLKGALAKSGASFSSRTIRVSVAEPPKERGGQNDDDSKFDNPWRRDGPIDSDSRDAPRRRFDSTSNDRGPGPSEGASDWRSSRPRPAVPDSEAPPFRRKGSGFVPSESVADKEDVWTLGGKFKPASGTNVDDSQGSKAGGLRGKDSPLPDEGDWRSNSRPKAVGRNSTSPSNSNPPTPQLGRRKLELLPRTGGAPSSPTGTGASMSPLARPNPFGGAKPVDVSSREQEVIDRLAKERELNKDRASMSRTNSRTGSDRSPQVRTRTPPPNSSKTATPPAPSSPKILSHSSTVKPSISFANAASSKEGMKKGSADAEETEGSVEPAS